MGIYGFFLVFMGGGLGSAGRYGVNLLAAKLCGTDYPFGTFAINVVGAFAMGAAVELFTLRSSIPPTGRLFLTTGIIGGFTTFSTYALEIGLLYKRGEMAVAIFYGLSSLVCGLAALFIGIGVVRYLEAC